MKTEKPPMLSVEEQDIPWETPTEEAAWQVYLAIQKLVEEAKAEVAREIFEGIRKLLIPTNVEPNSPVPNFYIRETKLGELKSKYMEGK